MARTTRSRHLPGTLSAGFGAGVSVAAVAMLLATGPAAAAILFDTGTPNGLMATASRPGVPAAPEIEAADDFILNGAASITGGTFTGLIASTTGALPTIGNVAVEIYRVFPNDSTNPPSGNVPTRVNSPSDVAFATRDNAGGTLSFLTTTLSASFTANNSVQAGGIHPSPNQTTGGDGAVTGQEVRFTFTLSTTLDLQAGHYFFVPQVEVTGGNFLWLSAPKPITGGTGPFATDLQSWIRDANLDPDWLRVGTDIVGGSPAPTFNAAFSLNGDVAAVPEPAAPLFLATGLIGLALVRRRA